MKQTYTHLLTFVFRHRYFMDDLFKVIEVSFAEGTPKLIKDLGIVIKPFPGGLHLLASDPELLDSINDTNPIQLVLHCKDPQYINYTELPPYRLPDKLLYFNNLSAVSTGGNKSFRLHNKEFAGQNELVQISYGKINFPEFNADNKNRLTDAVGNEIPPQCITKSVPESGALVLSNLPQGLIRLFSNKEEVDKVYYYPKAVWNKPFGIVEIYTTKLFKQYKESGLVEYVLNFDNRQTIWKYFLVSPVYQKFNNLSIINKGKEQIFKTPQKQLVHKNSEALVFESKNKIPLRELSDETYQLVDNYDPNLRSGKVILKNLVKASAEQLYADENQLVESAYSHIYI
jgi:hypothetical protein